MYKRLANGDIQDDSIGRRNDGARPLIGEERIVEAVLADEFRQAATDYADELLANLNSLEVKSFRRLMWLRERFLNLRRMQIARS